MNRKDLVLCMAMATAAGFAGGIATRFASDVPTAQAAQYPDVVGAHSFVLIGPDGKARAGLLIKGDNAALVIFGPNKQSGGLQLGVDGAGPRLEFKDADDHVRAGLVLPPNQDAEFDLLDPDETPRLQARGGAIRTQAYVVVNQKGNTRGALDVSDEGLVGLSLGDGGGKLRAALGVTSDGLQRLLFLDPDGKISASFPPSGQ